MRVVFHRPFLRRPRAGRPGEQTGNGVALCIDAGRRGRRHLCRARALAERTQIRERRASERQLQPFRRSLLYDEEL